MLGSVWLEIQASLLKIRSIGWMRNINPEKHLFNITKLTIYAKLYKLDLLRIMLVFISNVIMGAKIVSNYIWKFRFTKIFLHTGPPIKAECDTTIFFCFFFTCPVTATTVSRWHRLISLSLLLQWRRCCLSAVMFPTDCFFVLEYVTGFLEYVTGFWRKCVRRCLKGGKKPWLGNKYFSNFL